MQAKRGREQGRSPSIQQFKGVIEEQKPCHNVRVYRGSHRRAVGLERALVDTSGELTLILAKALDFAWETAMALLFLGAKDHRIPAGDLDNMREEYARINTETSRSVLRLYQSRKNAAAAESDQRRLPQLHAVG
jgi:hypothetical protein